MAFSRSFVCSLPEKKLGKRNIESNAFSDGSVDELKYFHGKNVHPQCTLSSRNVTWILRIVECQTFFGFSSGFRGIKARLLENWHSLERSQNVSSRKSRQAQKSYNYPHNPQDSCQKKKKKKTLLENDGREGTTAFACWCSKRAFLASRDSFSYLPSLIWLLKSYAVWILFCQMYHHCYTFQRQTFLDTFEERDTREIFLTDYLKLQMYYMTLTICSKYIKLKIVSCVLILLMAAISGHALKW